MEYGNKNENSFISLLQAESKFCSYFQFYFYGF